MFAQIKRFLEHDTTFFSLLLLLIGVGSFGLGRLSVPVTSPEQTAMVTLTEPAPTVRNETQDTQVVVSVNGTKYHYLWCPGAGQMNSENKRFFASPAEAKAAGYEPAANCPELE